ncbi:polyketide synthase [Botrytis cinerea]
MDQDLLEPIAIVGISLKYPQDATGPEAFWKLIQEKRCTMTEWPSDSLNIDAFYHPDKKKNSTIYTRGGNFLKGDLAAFDPSFFSITAEEAKAMDPQHRLLLETTYQALENAGIPLSKASGTKTGVYTGSMADDYRFTSLKDPEDLPKYAVTGTAMSLLANRLSWFFNLGGPSINLDSACSSSLMALDIACQGLRNGDSSMAIVAGSCLISCLETWISLCNMGFLSPDSRCYSFDNRANGYARSEGVGVVIIKKLSDALKDNDTIRAVIRATGSNSDGHTPGITQPSREAQTRLIEETYIKGGLDPAKTRYFEAHGTGTPLGDPIEAGAIGSVFREYRSATEPLYVGALKPNIGHLEGGSGIAGLIKTVLVLEKGIIPPNANFEQANSNIDAEFFHLRFPTEQAPWPSQGLRRASVNSFGFGGSNSHCIVDDAYHFLKLHSLVGNHNTIFDSQICQDSLESEDKSYVNRATAKSFKFVSDPQLLVFSAVDKDGIRRVAEAYRSYFAGHALKTQRSQLSFLRDLAYTLSVRRTAFVWRSFIVTDTLTDLLDLPTKISLPIRAASSSGVAFIFTGQGAQYSRMGTALLSLSVFRDTLKKANEIFRQLGCTWCLFDELAHDKSASNINDPAYAQPLCTALQLALIKLLRKYGVSPTIVLGHSSGEIAAAYACGGLSFKSACKVAFFRGQVAQKIRQDFKRPPRAMISINLAEFEIQPYLTKLVGSSNSGSFTTACVNSPCNVTLSGLESDIDLLQQQLNTDGIFGRKLKTGVAYHSPQMNEVAHEYSHLIQSLTIGRTPLSPVVMISSVTGERIANVDCLSQAQYWVRNMVGQVNFLKAYGELVSTATLSPKRKLGAKNSSFKVCDVLEIGPHPALQRYVKDISDKLSPKPELRYHSTLSRNASSTIFIKDLAGRLSSLGYKINFDCVNEPQDPCTSQQKLLVDLPEYPFNHSRSYWHEPRRQRELNLRESPELELLGTPMTRVSWIQDHKVNGKVIYPATGMIVMAIEASKQMAPKDQKINGFRLRDIIISNPIQISSQDPKTEAQLCMRPLQNSSEKTAHLTISVEYQTDITEVDHGKVERDEQEDYTLKHEAAARECIESISKEALYQCTSDMGVELGSSFKRLDKILYDGNKVAIADLTTFDWAGQEGIDAVESHTIHPTTLDALVQLSWIPLTDGFSTKIPTMIPTRIENAWISNTGLSYQETRSNTSLFFALDRMGELRLSLSRLESSIVSDTTTFQEKLQPRQLSWYISWKPDVVFLKPHGVLRFCRSETIEEVDRIKVYQTLESMLKYFAKKALNTISEVEEKNAKPFIQKYLASLRRYLKRYGGSPTLEVLPFYWKGAPRDHTRSSKSTRDSFLGGKIAELYYRDICVRGTYGKDIARYLDLLAHKNPGLDVLEIGSGTGSFTECILSALIGFDGTERCTERFNSYHYTDISPSFFEQAREKFGPFIDRLHFRVLDIEGDLASQGFGEGSFDLVLAHSVLHATSSLAHTLQNCRKLLRPGGKLIMLENTQPDLMRTGFVFGTLEGWWLSTEEFRSGGPCVSEETWRKVLVKNGFTGVDFSICDTDDPRYHEYSLIVSTANEEDIPTTIQKLIFLVDLASSRQVEVVRNIRAYLKPSINMEIQLLSYKQTISIKDAQSSFLVFLPEIEVPFLHDLSSSDFDVLKHMCISAKNILWVSHSSTASVLSQKLLITGMSKDMEYVAHDNLLYTGRIIEAKALDQQIHTRIHEQTRKVRVDQAGAVALTLKKPGLLESLQFTRDENFHLEIGPDEVEIKVQYIGLNFRDLLVSLGRYHNNDNLLGCESSGIVTRVGVNCKTFVPGDRACVAKFGCMNTYVRAHSDLVFQIPKGMTSEEAAGSIMPGSTAYHSLINVAKLKRGESILIHAASGATGQMAIQIAKYLNCDIYVTVGFDKKKKILMEQYGIPEDHIFYSRNLSFVKGIRRMTQGRGIDVVLNYLSGDALIATWELIAPYGRFIELGTLDIYTNTKLPMSSFAKNVTFAAITIDSLNIERPKEFREIMLNVIDYFHRGIFHSVKPFHLISIGNLKEAMRLLQGGKTSGKIVLSLDSADIIPATNQPQALWTFDSKSTYIIAGGLGGLGRSTALWMANKGAKYLVLLSRSGPVTEAATSLLTKLSDMGVSVEVPKCDITYSDQLRKVISQFPKTFPPIKGCIQATMVLKDVLFEKMNFEEWSAATSPKVRGTWNLHEALPDNLDFFILLSSIAGVFGSMGQSNYAAGNTFQDAFCLYRSSQGQKTISLRLGIMSDVGIISENPDVLKIRDLATESASVKEAEFLALLDHYCSPDNPLELLGSQETLPIIDCRICKRSKGSGVDSNNNEVDEVIGVELADIDTNKPFHAYGVDSLLAVELRNWFGKELGTNVAVYDIMGAENIRAMSDFVARNSSLVVLKEEA